MIQDQNNDGPTPRSSHPEPPTRSRVHPPSLKNLWKTCTDFFLLIAGTYPGKWKDYMLGWKNCYHSAVYFIIKVFISWPVSNIFMEYMQKLLEMKLSSNSPDKSERLKQSLEKQNKKRKKNCFGTNVSIPADVQSNPVDHFQTTQICFFHLLLSLHVGNHLPWVIMVYL